MERQRGTRFDAQSSCWIFKTVQKNDPLIKVAEGLGIYIGKTN